MSSKRGSRERAYMNSKKNKSSVPTSVESATTDNRTSTETSTPPKTEESPGAKYYEPVAETPAALNTLALSDTGSSIETLPQAEAADVESSDDTSAETGNDQNNKEAAEADETPQAEEQPSGQTSSESSGASETIVNAQNTNEILETSQGDVPNVEGANSSGSGDSIVNNEKA